MNQTEIDQVRRFNRAVTQRVGALSNDYLDRGRSLGEARLLFEIGPKGGDVSALRAKLGLDPGYMSRLLRSLEGQGLVVTRTGSADARTRRAELTAEGRKEYRAYDKTSDAFAEAMLRPLSERERTRLLAAMAEVERLLRASTVSIEIEDAAGRDAQYCLERYFDELRQRFETGYDPAKGLPASGDLLNPPNGLFLIARLEGAPVGCIGLKRRSRREAEVKRMWVAPSTRGLGIGRRLLQVLEKHATGLGVRRLRLDTNRSLTEARALYVAQAIGRSRISTASLTRISGSRSGSDGRALHPRAEKEPASSTPMSGHAGRRRSRPFIFKPSRMLRPSSAMFAAPAASSSVCTA